MLPTSGLFKDIDCPYYDNYCGRPYCHFRHRKRNPDSAAEDSQDGTEIPTYKPTPKSQLAAQQAKSHIPISYVPDTVIRPERLNRIPSMYNYMEKITYKPTPLSELSKNNAINTTAELINKELFSKIGDGSKDDAEPDRMGGVSVKDNNGNCDIDFEELSTEFDMIDDIINESSSAENVELREDEKESKQKLSDRKTSSQNSSKSSSHSGTSKNHHKKSSKSSTSSKSSKDDKSKPSRSNNSHKSSHKPKSERSSSKERHREKSAHKDEKKRDKDPHHKSKDKSSSKHRKSSHSSRERKDASDKTKIKINKEEKPKKDPPKPEDDHDVDDIFNEDLEEECYRIFNEYKPETIHRNSPSEEPQLIHDIKQENVEEYVPTVKKRIAHSGAEQYVPKVTHTKPKPSQNAAVQMANRYKLAREAQMNDDNDIVSLLSKHQDAGGAGTKRQSHLLLELHKNVKKAKIKMEVVKEEKATAEQPTSLIDEIINGKQNTITYKPTPIAKLSEDRVAKPLRIAPAMNVNSIQQAKARIAELSRRNLTNQKTPIQTIGKGNKRVAHTPDTSLAELPDPLQPESKKIPLNVRARYLTMIADECVKLYLNREDAYTRAVNEEVKVLERCAAIVTYRNSAMLTVNRIRKEVQVRQAKGLGPMTSDEPGEVQTQNNFKGRRFYENIQRYVLTGEELEEHGYPREGPIAGKAVISTQKQLPRVNLDENQRLCARCFKVYLVDDVGFPVHQDDCIYHPLKKRTLRGERIYLCCKSPDDMGCVTSNTHVSDNDETELLGYQTTMDPETDDDVRSYAVYALDCEMCYTTKGLELTRVTIVDSDCKTVYESLVKPINPIIDYNTQFSGITKDQMDRTSTSILQVQANILHLCNSKTILIGHSLESDMKALKIIHSCIIDTAIMFPHRLGLPHKRALRTLASEYLTKIIQGNIAGHDSAEDAITCMELVIWKLKEDLKVRGVK